MDPQGEPKKQDFQNETEGAMSSLKKDYMVIGKSRVKPWHVWVSIGAVAGIVAAFVFISNDTGEFEAGEAALRNVTKLAKVNCIFGLNGSENFKKIESGKCERIIDGDSDAYRVGCQASVDGQCNLNFQSDLVFEKPMNLSEIRLKDLASKNVTVQVWAYANETWSEIFPILQGNGSYVNKSVKGNWQNIMAVRVNANGNCGAAKASCSIENRLAEIRVFGETSAEANALRVVSPNGGERWQLYSSHTIKWVPYDPANGLNPASDFTAYLEKQNKDGSFEAVGKILEGGKASIHWTGEIDEWGKYPKPGDYYVRIVNNKTGEEDRSDKSFEIVPDGIVKADLRVEGKNAPFYVSESKKYKVSWSSNADSCWIYNPTIPWVSPPWQEDQRNWYPDLKPDGSMMIQLNPNGSPYSMSVSLGCESTKKVEGSVYAYVELLPTPGSFIQVSRPDFQGLQLGIDKPSMIYWNASSDIKSVSIALYKNDKHFKWIATNLPHGFPNPPNKKGDPWAPWPDSYEWTPSKTISKLKIGPNDTFKIYVVGYKSRGGTIDDKSDNAFTIFP